MGKQGECSREQAKRAILLFAADKKKRKRSEFIEELVKKKHEFAKNTIYKYLDELVTDNLMKMEPGSREDSFRPVCSITKQGLKAVRQIDVHDLVDSFGTEWLEIIRRLLANMYLQIRPGTDPSMNPEEFFKHQCIAFIGRIPYNFDKSIEGMKYVLRFERDLADRGAKDGLMKEEYFRKWLKRILEQPPGIRRILAGMGLEEEQIEAKMRMEEAIKKQGIADVYGRIRQEEESGFETQLFTKFQSIHSRAKQDLRWIIGKIPPMERYRLNDIWREEGIL